MPIRRQIILTLLLNGLLPWGIYVWLSGYMSSLSALTLATVVPMLENGVHVLRHRKLDAFGSLMLFTFLLTLVLAVLGGGERLLLVRESFVTAAVGLIFLGSLFFSRPFMYHLAARFLPSNRFADNWKYAYFRYVLRLMTVVWGIALVSEAVVRMILVFQLSTVRFLAVSNFVLYGFLGITIAWTVLYRKHSARRLQTVIDQSRTG